MHPIQLLKDSYMKIRLRVLCVWGGGGGGEIVDLILKAPLIQNLLLSKILCEPVITLRLGNLQHKHTRTHIQ